jgi:two-component system sensor histidine kinase HydH
MPRLRSSTFSLVFLLSTLLFVLGSSAAWYVRDLYQDLSTMLELNVASVRSAEELEIVLREMHARLAKIDDTPNAKDLEEIESLRRDTDHWLKEASRLATTLKERDLMAKVNAGYDQYRKAMDAYLIALQSGKPEREAPQKIGDILTEDIIPPAHEYLDYNELTMISVAQSHLVFSNRFSWLLLGMGIVGSFGGFFAGLKASRRLRRSMVELNLPLSLAAGRLSEVVGPVRLSTSLDLEELKRVLEAMAGEVDKVVVRLQKSQEDVLRSEKLAAVGQLAAGTAHEIRNPLMSIKLLVQAALNDPDHSALNDADYRLIVQEICRLEKTVQNLLDFAKQPLIERQRVGMESLVNYCISLIVGRASIQNVSITQQIDSANLEVEADAQQLQQVLLNLFINALDAMPEGGSLNLVVKKSADAQVSVSIEDSGTGIPETILPQMFEPFVSSKESGIGLGLSISQKIIEAHHGAMFAQNRIVGGSVVGFSIPLAAAREARS